MDGSRALSLVATNEIARAVGVRIALVQAIEGLLGNDAWFLWPSAAGAAPRRGLSDAEIDASTGGALVLGHSPAWPAFRRSPFRSPKWTCCPFGLSLIGLRGSDRALLAAAGAAADLRPSPLKESPS